MTWELHLTSTRSLGLSITLVLACPYRVSKYNFLLRDRRSKLTDLRSCCDLADIPFLKIWLELPRLRLNTVRWNFQDHLWHSMHIIKVWYKIPEREIVTIRDSVTNPFLDLTGLTTDSCPPTRSPLTPPPYTKLNKSIIMSTNYTNIRFSKCVADLTGETPTIFAADHWISELIAASAILKASSIVLNLAL